MNPYDQVPYVNHPYAQTHPSRLFVLARLAGLNPPPVERCRVLELGASEGANIIGMAVVLPGAEFLGMDLAAEPVTRGERAIAELGLPNARLLRMDVLDVEASFGEFDYVLAHGLYAWTPAPVRDKILAIARANLHPQGVAFVSYNTNPGGHLRRILRDMMLYRAGRFEDPAERLEEARALLRVVADGPPEPDVWDAAVAAQAAEFLTRAGGALFHDELGEIYEPLYFHEFAAHAARHGLQYLGDAGTVDSQPRNLTPEAIGAARRMAGGDRIAEQQYFDFLRVRRFRQSLLCHGGVELLPEWEAERIEGSYAASPAHETPEGAFVTSAGTRLTTSHPAPVEYMRRLIAQWPRTERVTARDAPVALELFRVGMIELHAIPGMAARAGEKPCASPLVRYQAARGDPSITTLWHRVLKVEGEPARRMLALLDGTRDRAALAEAIGCEREVLEAELDALGGHAVLIR